MQSLALHSRCKTARGLDTEEEAQQTADGHNIGVINHTPPLLQSCWKQKTNKLPNNTEDHHV